MLPVFTYYVQATGPVRIRRNGPTLYSVGFRWQSGSGSGSFVFEYDVDEVTIPLPAGTWFSIYSLQLMPGACPTISQATGTPAALAPGAVSRQWDKPIPRPVNPT